MRNAGEGVVHVTLMQRLAWVPVLLLIASVVALSSIDGGGTYESAPVLVTLNTLFCAAVGFLIVAMATKHYLSTGSETVLILGCGALAFAMTYLLSGILLYNLNAAVTFHNTGVFLASLCFAGSAGLWIRWKNQKSGPGTPAYAGISYLGVLAGIGLVAVSSLSGLTPVFWSPESGMTLLRQAVLAATMAGFAFAAFCFGILYSRSRLPFHFWFRMSMVLMSLGMGILIIEGNPATLVSWTGRAAQYLGGLYLLAAVVRIGTGTGERETHIELALRNTESRARESEERFRTLFETMTEGFVLLEIVGGGKGRPFDYRFLEINPAFETVTGMVRDQIVGKLMTDILPAEDSVIMDTLRGVASSGRTARFEYFFPSLMRHYNINAFSPGNKRIAILFSDITEKRASEEALRESEERFRLALRNAPVSVAIQDNDLVFRWVYNQLTVNPEDVIGKTDTDIFTPEDAAYLLQLKRRVIATGNDEHEQIWLNMNGQRMFLDLYIHALQDETGGINGVGIATVNLTALKETEEELRESTGRLHEALELLDAVTKGTDVIIAAQDTNFRYTYFNEAYAEEIKRLTGKDLSPGMSMIDLFDQIPDEQMNALKEWDRVMSGESVNRRIDFGVPGKNGRSYHVLHTPIRDADGSIIGAGEVAYNITEQAKTELELRETKTYLENLITYANAPIIVWDPDVRITRFNQAFERLTGMSADDAIGQTLDILFPANSQHEAMDLIRKTMAGEWWERVEIPILHRNGNIRNVLWNSAPIYGSDGKTLLSIIAQGQDITEQKKFEKDLTVKARDLMEINKALGEEVAHRRSTEARLITALSLLNASLESTADGIVVIDLSGKITSYNKNFIDMWGVTEGMVKSGDNTQVTHSIAIQLKNPGYFRESMETLIMHPERESYDMVELQDGRIFERFTKPQKVGDVVVGRLWSYRDITDRRRAEERLVASLKEKEVLLKEVHHRVKNNLQLISGLIDMTRLRTADPSTFSVLTDLMLKIQTMAQIHTHLYESKQFGRIPLHDQIQDQVSALSDIFSHTDLEILTDIHSSRIYLPVDLAIPFALVVNEILSNAYKHAFRGRNSGSVSITTEMQDGSLRLTIRDNGIGLPDEFDIYKTRSLGIKLVRTLVENQLKGVLKFNTDHGTEVVVEFPFPADER